MYTIPCMAVGGRLTIDLGGGVLIIMHGHGLMAIDPRIRTMPGVSTFHRPGRPKGAGVLNGRDVLDLMHGRSRMTIDPRIPTIPARGIGGGILRIADILTERLGVCEEFDWVGFLVICSV